MIQSAMYPKRQGTKAAIAVQMEVYVSGQICVNVPRDGLDMIVALRFAKQN